MTIIGLTGYSGAGKSSAAKYLVDAHGFYAIGFHKELKKIATKKGYPRVRQWLLADGIQCIAQHAVDAILYEVEAQLHMIDRFVIDGLYDIELSNVIAERYPNAAITTIAVLANKKIRTQRVQTREHLNSIEAVQEVAFIDTFKDKIGIRAVFEKANVFFTNEDDVSLLYNAIEKII